jgi:6-phosphogluconolactonase
VYQDLRKFTNDHEVARAAARVVVDSARLAVSSKGHFSVALSGGSTPRLFFKALALSPMPWEQTVIYQVDERVVALDDPSRNLALLRECLPDAALIRPMPVDEKDLARAADNYALSLPASIDLIHLGLGADGHTASLVPGDAVLEVTDHAVGLTSTYQGHERMTLTYPGLSRARQLLWLVSGVDKRHALTLLLRGDHLIPAGRVEATSSMILADAAALG